MFAENIAVHAANTPGATHPRGTVVAPPKDETASPLMNN